MEKKWLNLELEKYYMKRFSNIILINNGKNILMN